MTTTTNYGMQLPSGSDPSDITPINQNTTFLDTKLKELEDVTDSVIDEIDKNTSSESGSVVTLTDEAPSTPLKSCVCDIEPVQASGTPSPDNPLAISGWSGVNVSVGGKNLLNPSLLLYQTSGYVWTDNYSTQGAIPIKGGERYVLSFKQGLGDGRIYQFNKGGQQVGTTGNFFNPSIAFVSEADAVSLSFRYKILDGDTPTLSDAEPQLELGTTATTYEPYTNSTTTTLTWTDAGTVYGGSIDLTSGELRVTHKMYTFDGSDDEGWGFNNEFKVAYNYFPETSRNLGFIPVCNIFQGVDNISYAFLSTWECAYTSSGTGTAEYAINFKTTYEDLDEFKSALSNTNLQVLLKLTTPLTYQLTPTTIKTLSSSPTNLWADTGDTAITYVVNDKYSNSGIPTVEAVKQYIMDMLGI